MGARAIAVRACLHGMRTPTVYPLPWMTDGVLRASSSWYLVRAPILVAALSGYEFAEEPLGLLKK